MKHALVTGVTGQDGSYLAELLLDKGYRVYGLVRPSVSAREGRLGVLPPTAFEHPNFEVVTGDLTDEASLRKAVEESCPDEVYNLAAQSHVGLSFEQPSLTHAVNAVGAINLLNAVREVHGDDCRFYQASTSELFGGLDAWQDESTPLHPRSPYGVAKAAAHYAVQNDRERGNFSVAGFLFNHESPRRGPNFVTRKVCRAAARGAHVCLGSRNTMRDWGHARDYVRAMWMMLQAEEPVDYVVATGTTRTVEELVETARRISGNNFPVTWDVAENRPTEVYRLCGDSSAIRKDLGWKPEVSFEALIAEMVEAER
jgi:GDPmannose 4,6-dehydratase